MRPIRPHFVLLPRLNPHLEQILVVTVRHGSHADVARGSCARIRVQEGRQETVLRRSVLERLVDCVYRVLVLGVLGVVAEIPRNHVHATGRQKLDRHRSQLRQNGVLPCP